MNLYIDPVTGRAVMLGPGGPFLLPDSAERPMVGDLAARMEAMRRAQAADRHNARAYTTERPREDDLASLMEAVRQAQAAGRYNAQTDAAERPRDGELAALLEAMRQAQDARREAARQAQGADRDNARSGVPQPPSPLAGASGAAPALGSVPAASQDAQRLAPVPALQSAMLPPPPPPPPPPAPPPAAAQQAGALMAPTVRPPMSESEVDAFSARLGVSESGNRFDVMNPGGYVGRVQFGAPRLQALGVYAPGPGENLREWGAGGGARMAPNAWTGRFNIPGFPEVRTVEDFRRNPEAQRAVERAHWADIDQAIDSTPGAENFDRNGLRAVAHLGGTGGMRRFVESGGQFSPADGNGTTLRSYYQRYAGSDAPPGLAGRLGGSAALSLASGEAVPASGDALPTTKPAPADAVPADPAIPSFRGIPAGALLAAGAALIGGRTPAEGLSRAGQAFVQQANADRQFEQGRLDRAEARADRRVSQAQLEAFRRAQLALQQQRADQAGTRAAQGAATPYSFDGTVYRADDGSIYRQRMNRATGVVEWVNQRNEVVPADQVPQRLTRVQDTGERALNEGLGRDAADAAQNAFNAEAAIRTLRQSTANARDLIRRNPDLVGPSLRQQGGRFLARALGIPIDGKSPDEIAAIEQALVTGQTQQIIQMGQHLRPMSNVDLQAILRQVPSVMTDPRLLPAWLDQIDDAAARAERATRAFDELWRTPAGRRAIVEAGGVDAWFARYHRENSNREPGGAVPPNLQRTGQPGQPGTWRATPSGPPGSGRVIQPGERRELPGGIVIERIN